MSFAEQVQMVKGDYGELLVDLHYTAKGITIYKPIMSASHVIDRFYIDKNNQVVPVDVKTKPKRNLYPDTGFDFEDYDKYKKIRKDYQMDPFIIFVDENLGKVYGNKLSLLEKEIVVKAQLSSGESYMLKYPKGATCKHDKLQIYFPLKNMRLLFYLSKWQIETLKSLKDNYDTTNEMSKKDIKGLYHRLVDDFFDKNNPKESLTTESE